MAYTVDSRANTAASAVRDALARAERLSVKPSGETVEELLLLLDTIDEMLETMGAAGGQHSGLDLRPEETRWETLLRRINGEPGLIVRAAAQAGGLAQLRAKHPPAESFWWHLDAEWTRRRTRSARRFFLTTAAILLVVFGGYWLVNRLFPPEPEAVFLLEAQYDIDRAVMAGDYAAALDFAAAARSSVPHSVELAIWEAVLTERTGDLARSEELLAEAQTLIDDEELFWILTGNTRFQAADLAGADRAAQRALELNPDSAQAFFLLGNLAESTGDRRLAIDLFTHTSELAEAEDPQLSVIAKVRLAQLLQAPDFDFGITPTAAPSDGEPIPSPTPAP